MARWIWVSLCSALLLAVVVTLTMVALKSTSAPPDLRKATQIPRDSPDMNAAKEIAKQSLPQFWTKFVNPEPREVKFAVQVTFKTGDATEHIWMNRLEREGDLIYGTVASKPETTEGVELGQRIAFEESQISDWVYWKDNKFYGHFTLEAKLKFMPKAQADYWRSLRAEK